MAKTKRRMKPVIESSPPIKRFTATRWLAGGLLAWLMLLPDSTHASLFEGETLDTIADVMTWIVLIVAPIIGIVVFLLIHILPEKIAEKKQHPQAKAIQCLCLLSLLFGGMLWPLAWLWTYTKPVLYRMAYGSDKVAPEHVDAPSKPHPDEATELKLLRQRVAELEARLAHKGTEGGKA